MFLKLLVFLVRVQIALGVPKFFRTFIYSMCIILKPVSGITYRTETMRLQTKTFEYFETKVMNNDVLSQIYQVLLGRRWKGIEI